MFKIETREICHRTSCLNRLIEAPAAIRISDNDIVVFGILYDGPSPDGIERRVTADLQLETMDSSERRAFT